MSLHVVGVRHHSPACARLVRATILRVRPRFVLIEGPCDVNDRISELTLEHRLPIAIYSFASTAEHARGTWCPFCDYSPEYVALRAAREVGARAFFMDLPAWDHAFEAVENRYADRHTRFHAVTLRLARSLGLDDGDALWDHLFEQPVPQDKLASALALYFQDLRGTEHAGDRDAPREGFMARWIAWAMGDCAREGGDVVAVCGGYHKPALEAAWTTADPAMPATPPPDEGTRVGSYLVPYTFQRLDSFAGYESGMPSPAFYQAVWDQSAERAGEAMLFGAITSLRGRGQHVSPADSIAASTLSHGLRALRGHATLGRTDVLDGLAGALLKDAIDAPLPWSVRGPLAPGTHPMLAAVVAAFSGDRLGTLAPDTPRPPLVHDAFAQLEAAGVKLGPAPAPLRVVLTSPEGLARSRVLHQLRVLRIPGFQLTREVSLSRARTDLAETWTVHRALEADPALVEAAIHGASLAAAAAGKLTERARAAGDMAASAILVLDAARAGLTHLSTLWLASIARTVGHEPSLSVLGGALARLLGLWRHDTLLGVAGHADLGAVLAAAFDRGLWLFESTQGGAVPSDPEHVGAIVALRDLLRDGGPVLALDTAHALSVCERRARDPEAPPALRGAGLGWRCTLPEPWDVSLTVDALRAASHPSVVGDFLYGLFALAREEVLRAPTILAAIDESMAGMDRDDFLIALPALRQAFAFFPPREKVRIAETALARHGGSVTEATAMVTRPVDAALVRAGAALDAHVTAVARRFGLADAEDTP
ncbi:MAG: DUF5682 family protein [Deltaproteobacteria bacterium]